MPADQTAGWQPIETADELAVLILYFPAVKSGRSPLGSMMRIAKANATPFRRPTHWLPLPEEPKGV